MDDKPESAIEYCYNRNKRNADGQVVSANWYLPNILEIQEIVTKAYIQFDDFQNKFYWSCQPAYSHYHYFYNVTFILNAKATSAYMSDNKNYARATKYNYDENKYYPSGMKGYVGTTYQTELSANGYEILPVPHTYTYTYNAGSWLRPEEKEVKIEVSPAASYDEGYKHRTNDQCRVRAVRKMN